jgi:hypothetical protein
MARIGKRERALIAAAYAARNAHVEATRLCAPALAAEVTPGKWSRMAQTPSLNRAYNPPTEALTASGRGRVMHNAQGHAMRAKGKGVKDIPVFDNSEAHGSRSTSSGLGSLR